MYFVCLCVIIYVCVYLDSLTDAHTYMHLKYSRITGESRDTRVCAIFRYEGERERDLEEGGKERGKEGEIEIFINFLANI